MLPVSNSRVPWQTAGHPGGRNDSAQQAKFAKKRTVGVLWCVQRFESNANGIDATSPLYMYICASVLDMTLLAQRQIVARPTAVKHGAGGKSSRKENVCTTSQPRRTPAVANAWNLGGVLMFSSRAPGSGHTFTTGPLGPFRL